MYKMTVRLFRVFRFMVAWGGVRTHPSPTCTQVLVACALLMVHMETVAKEELKQQLLEKL